MGQRPLAALQRQEVNLCLAFSRLQRQRSIRVAFVLASRLGDGGAWVVLLIALLVVQGSLALPAVLHMGLTALTGFAFYRLIKKQARRLRPCDQAPHLVPATPALDHYSFPSGHTLHAVLFTSMAISYYPALAIWLVPLTIMIAASRVILGLHYPSDVLAGAGMGLVIAQASLAIAGAIT